MQTVVKYTSPSIDDLIAQLDDTMCVWSGIYVVHAATLRDALVLAFKHHAKRNECSNIKTTDQSPRQIEVTKDQMLILWQHLGLLKK